MRPLAPRPLRSRKNHSILPATKRPEPTPNNMYLKEIETQPPAGVMKIAFKKLSESGFAIPEILHLFRFKKRSTSHLVRYTEEVMRGPSPLSRGLRELIGAYVSSRNQCSFCSCAHAPVASHLLGNELVEEVLRDLETSRLDSAHKELLRYTGKLATNPALVTNADIDRLKDEGWSEEAIYDALTVASLFKFYNTWNNGSGVRDMGPADYLHSGNRIITMGYCMDFNLKGTMKVMWKGRKEIDSTDLKWLLEIVASKFRGAFSFLGTLTSLLPSRSGDKNSQVTGACETSAASATPA
jgi:uncharacterized peroxidase-related enzyme